MSPKLRLRDIITALLNNKEFFKLFNSILNRYIMFGRGICEKYQSRDKQFPRAEWRGKFSPRLVFFANTPPKHDISV